MRKKVEATHVASCGAAASILQEDTRRSQLVKLTQRSSSNTIIEITFNASTVRCSPKLRG